MNYYAITRSNSLQHHGVKGMKWGVRRNPKQLGISKSFSLSRNTSIKDMKNNISRKRLSDEQKKVLKKGAKVAGTTLAAYGTYKVVKMVAIAAIGRKSVSYLLNNLKYAGDMGIYGF